MTVSTYKKGFTLIELLVVVSIIALLTSIVLTSLTTVRARARDAQRVAAVKQVATALELYRTTNGTYPIKNSWNGYCTGTFNPGNANTLSGATGYVPNLAPNYIPELPVDPKDPKGGCYLYRTDNTGSEYMFMAYGTVEGALIPTMVRPAFPTERNFAVYTSGAGSNF